MYHTAARAGETTMHKHAPLHRWDADVAAYLCSRRVLGRRCSADERILGKLRAFLAQTGARDLDRPHFDAWHRQFGHCTPNTRIDYGLLVQRFCRYRRRIDPTSTYPIGSHSDAADRTHCRRQLSRSTSRRSWSTSIACLALHP